MDMQSHILPGERADFFTAIQASEEWNKGIAFSQCG